MLSENTKKYAKFIDKREQNIYTVAVDKRSARREVATSDGPDHEGMHFMAKSIMDHDRVLRQVLREAVERFNTNYLTMRSASFSSTASGGFVGSSPRDAEHPG